MGMASSTLPLLQRPQRRAMAAAGRREAGIAARRAANIIARTCKLPGEKERTFIAHVFVFSIVWNSIMYILQHMRNKLTSERTLYES